MKKVIYTILLLASVSSLHAQGFLNKIKNKIAKAGEKQAAPALSTSAATSPGKEQFTDPSKFGTLIKTFSSSELSAAMGTFDLWFQSVKVVNNQLQLKIADYSKDLYSYSNGQLQKIGQPDISLHNKLINGSEKDLRSIDFTESDQSRAILKNGAHIASGQVPGKIGQTYTFNGKVVGDFIQARIAHNADSSVIVIVGSSYAKGGMTYSMVTSNGQHTALPVKYGAMPLISPDGKLSAAVVQSATGTDVFISNGNKVSTGIYNSNFGLWLRNNGSVFYVDNNNANALYKDGTLYKMLELPVNPKMLFISSDDKTMCWESPHAICFSDGSVFENASSSNKVILNGKEVIIFLTVNLQSGEVYLCRHDL